MATLQANIQRIRNGCITTLLACQTCALILMDYDVGQTSTLLSFGHFSINLALHLNCLLHATFCCVEGFVWPLARDTLVVRISKRSFVFALPGLLYGLQFPTSCQPAELINTFVEVVIQFAHYKDISNNGQGYLVEDKEPNIWNKVRPNIEALADETLKSLGHLPGRSRFMLPDLINACSIRATRMSRSTKQLIEGMKIGTLANTFVKFIHPSNNAHDDQGSAYASVRAFSFFVDCAEIAWLQGHGYVVNEEPLHVFYHDTDFKLWEFTKDGFLAFMRILRSSVAIKNKEELLNLNIAPIRKGKRSFRFPRVNWEGILNNMRKGKRSVRSPRVNWEGINAI